VPRPKRRRWGRFFTCVALLTWVAIGPVPVVWAVPQAFEFPTDIFAIPPKWMFRPTLAQNAAALNRRGFSTAEPACSVLGAHRAR
jgi:ABC-type glycerol-3-phosphate transport system permease component